MFPLKVAETAAIDMCHKLIPCCEVVRIAGSIRRRCTAVKDIELVLIPKTRYIGSLDLFGEDTRKVEPVPRFAEVIKEIGKIEKGSHTGGYVKVTHQISSQQKISVDIFIPRQEDYYRQFVIRTGSSEYVINNISSRWSRNGWCGVPGLGLRRQEDCEQVIPQTPGAKPYWKLVNKKGELPPAWQSEEHFYGWLGVQYLIPKFRTI